MKHVLPGVLLALCFISQGAIAQDDGKIFLTRYTRADGIRLYSADGKLTNDKVKAADLPLPPVEVVGKGTNGNLIGIKLKAETVYLTASEALTSAPACPVGTLAQATDGEKRVAGEVAGAGGGNIRCVPTQP